MHPDLEAILILDAHDEELARLDAALDNALALVSSAEAELREAEAARDEAEGAREAARAEEHALNRKLHSYEQRRRGALVALETGQGSPTSAQKQLDQVLAIMDDLETQVLELMEQQGAHALACEQAAQGVLAAQDVVEEAQRVAPPEIARLTAERSAEQAKRDAAASETRPDLLQQYELVRKRKKRAVVQLDSSGRCPRCYTIPPAGQLQDAKRGAILIVCRCQRWLAP